MLQYEIGGALADDDDDDLTGDDDCYGWGRKR